MEPDPAGPGWEPGASLGENVKSKGLAHATESPASLPAEPEESTHFFTGPFL